MPGRFRISAQYIVKHTFEVDADSYLDAKLAGAAVVYGETGRNPEVEAALSPLGLEIERHIDHRFWRIEQIQKTAKPSKKRRARTRHSTRQESGASPAPTRRQPVHA